MAATRLIALITVGLLLTPTIPAAGQPFPSKVGADDVSVNTATGTVTIHAPRCGTPVRYSVKPGPLPEGGSYDVKATLRDREGRNFGSDDAWMKEDSTFRGSIYPRCGKELTSGRYSVEVTVKVFDDYLDPVETRTGKARVRLRVIRPAPTRLVVRKTPYGSAGWQWTGRLTSRGRPVAGQRIDLWWDLFGWANYEVSKRTNGNGIAHWVSNPDGALGGILFRLKFRGTPKFAPSQSTVFNIAPR